MATGERRKGAGEEREGGRALARGGHSHRRCVQSRDRGQDVIKRLRNLDEAVKRSKSQISPSVKSQSAHSGLATPPIYTLLEGVLRY